MSGAKVNILCRVLFVGAATAMGGGSVRAAEVVVRTIDGDEIVGRIVSFSAEGGLVLVGRVGEEEIHIPSRDVIEVLTDELPVALSAGASEIRAANGDRLIGTPGRFADERATFKLTCGVAVAIPLEQVRTWLTPSGRAEARRSEKPERTYAASDGDVLRLTNGDEVHGFITSVDSREFALEVVDGTSRIPYDRVKAAYVVPTGTDAPEGLSFRVELTDGSRLSSRRLHWSGDSISIVVFGGQARSVPLRHVAVVRVSGGRWQWLSELKPISVEQTPMISLDWPYKADRNVLGGPLRIGGRVFRRGIGVHSRSSLTYDLQGAYTEFVTSYGIDDAGGSLSDVNVDILVDGRRAHRRERVGFNKLYGPVRVDVAQADRIELIVEFGRMGGVLDRFDWIEPGLIRD